MDAQPLTDRELQRLKKADRKLAGGRLRFGLFGLTLGALGGLGWVALMALMLPGFSTGWHLKPPDGNGTHPWLEEILYWLMVHFGPIPGICILASGMFGLLFGVLSFTLLWMGLEQAHDRFAERAIAFGQFQPAFLSSRLRRRLAAR